MIVAATESNYWQRRLLGFLAYVREQGGVSVDTIETVEANVGLYSPLRTLAAAIDGHRADQIAHVIEIDDISPGAYIRAVMFLTSGIPHMQLDVFILAFYRASFEIDAYRWLVSRCVFAICEPYRPATFANPRVSY